MTTQKKIETPDDEQTRRSSHCYADILEHLQQLVDYVRPEVDGDLVEADIILKELLHTHTNVQKAFAEFRMLACERDQLRELVKAKDQYIACYKTGRRPTEKLFATLDRLTSLLFPSA